MYTHTHTHTHTHIYDLQCYRAESNTTLQSNYPPVKNKKRESILKFKRKGTYVYLWMIHVDVRQKPEQ